MAAKVEETGQLPKRAVKCKEKTKYGTYLLRVAEKETQVINIREQIPAEEKDVAG